MVCIMGVLHCEGVYAMSVWGMEGAFAAPEIQLLDNLNIHHCQQGM